MSQSTWNDINKNIRTILQRIIELLGDTKKSLQDAFTQVRETFTRVLQDGTSSLSHLFNNQSRKIPSTLVKIKILCVMALVSLWIVNKVSTPPQKQELAQKLGGTVQMLSAASEAGTMSGPALALFTLLLLKSLGYLCKALINGVLTYQDAPEGGYYLSHAGYVAGHHVRTLDEVVNAALAAVAASLLLK